MEIVIKSAVLVFFLHNFTNTNCQEEHIFNTAAVLDPVLLHGCHDEGDITQWKFNKAFLFIDNTLFKKGSSESIELLPNKSVYIKHVSLNHGGTYQCICGSSSIINYYVEVEAPPRLTIAASKQRHTENGTIIFLPENEVIVLSCSVNECRPEVNLTLVIDNAITATSIANVRQGIGYNETYSTTLSVTKEVVRDIGNISCRSYGLGMYSATGLSVWYLSYVPPTMSMWHNETELGNSIWLEENQTIDLICKAYNSKPRVNFTWFWDETAMNFSSRLNYTNVDHQSRLYNSSSTITYTVVEENGNITCSAGFDGSDLRWWKSVNVMSYVIPNLSISLNGESPVDGQMYNLNENLTIKCEQGRARPDANISLIVEGDGLAILIKSFRNATVMLSLNESGTFHVNCGSWQKKPNKTTNKIITYLVAEPATTTLYTPTQGNASSTEIHSPHVDLQYIVVAAASATLSSFLVFCLYKGLKKARASLSANLQSIDLSLGGVSSLRAASLRRAEALSLQSKLPPEMSEFDFGKIGTLPRTPEPTLKRSFTGPPRLKLPKIPSEEEVSQYSAESENYYSTTQETSSGRKMYGEKDMCIILNMKMGEIYNRWMGTIATSRETNKCVVFTTVTESTARKKEIHWDAFVKRALEMPKTNHVTCIEGIAIDKANFYLINEHVICDTLENKVLGKNTPEAETNLHPALMLSDVMKHATGIMEGMEVIHSFGFLHPGLSLKKVLLTNQGECKLYDFCLSEDASKIVETKKLQVTPSLNHFAPETLLRNEYVQGSDVWSIAVLMWEMMSIGNSPFHLEQELDTDDAIISPGKPWPERYQQLHNKTFFECWNKDCSLRPAVSHLKESFTKVFEALLENSFYEIPTSDLYAPMNAVTNFGGT